MTRHTLAAIGVALVVGALVAAVVVFVYQAVAAVEFGGLGR